MADPQQHPAASDDSGTFRGSLIDIGTGTLEPGRVLIESAGAGYFVAGIGEAARFVRFAYGGDGNTAKSDPFLSACRKIADAVGMGRSAATGRPGMPDPVSKISDPALRRLAVAETLTKAGFNPNEPRDRRGRWTSGGADAAAPGRTPRQRTSHAGARASNPAEVQNPPRRADNHIFAALASTASVAAGDFGTVFGELTPGALAALTDVGLAFTGALSLAGVFLFATPTGHIVSGTIPGFPHITYRYDSEEGRLTLSESGKPFYSGRAGADGLFRASAWEVIGRDLGERIAINRNALPTSTRDKSDARAKAKARSSKSKPQVCPAPTPENITRRSIRTLEYQSQITGLPPGWDVNLNGRRFDGCDEQSGDMIEAKGPGYQRFMRDPEHWKDWFRGAARIERQMRRQSEAAGIREVDWHFAEKPVAAFFATFVDRQQEHDRLMNIRVIYTPPEGPSPHGSQ